MISNIMFDLGNVLAPFDWAIALERLAPMLPEEKAALLRNDEPSFRRLFFRNIYKLETGRMDFESFYMEVCHELGLDITIGNFNEIWCDIFSPNWEMIELGEALARNYDTWLVSNTNTAHYRWLIERYPKVRFFKDAALSYELKVMKPDPLYYEMALNKFGARAEESVFIDDLEANVQGAEKAGFRALRFTGVDTLKRELTELGINID